MKTIKQKVKQRIKIINIIICVLSLPWLAVAQNLQDTISTGKSYTLDEIVVTGSRVPVPRDVTPIPVSVVHRGTIENSEETNLLPILMQQVPSLFITSRGIAGYGVSGGAAGGINLRGFSGGTGRVLILIDGHPQYATIYGHPVADAYIASNAQRVEVSRGAASILYGSNAMGGAINIITRKALEDGNLLSARLMGGSYGTQRYSVTDSYRKDKFSGVVSGDYERTDGHRANSEFESFSGYAKLGYDLSKQWKITGNINIAKSISENPGTVNAPMLDGRANVLRGMSGLSIENNYGITSGAMNFFYNWGNHKINDGHTAGQNPQTDLFKSTDYMSGVNIYQSVGLFKGNTITGGFDVKLYGGNAYKGSRIFADHVKLYEIAGYLFAQQELGRFMLTGGVRLENHELYGTEWVPQAGVSYKAADQTHLKFSISKGFRTPNMRELYMFNIANEDLMPERSLSYDFTISQGLLDNRMTAELTLYYITGDNIIESTEISPEVFQNRNVGEFANKGVEFSLNYRILNNLNMHTNYSYLYMDTPITGAPRHKLYAGLSYNPGKFSFNAGVQTIDKLILSTENNNIQESSYTLVDARISYHALKWLDIFVKGNNLTAREYETMQGYPMPRATCMGGVSLNL